MTYRSKWHFSDDRQPIQSDSAVNRPISDGRIPTEIAKEAYQEYADEGHGSQSFERMHERGGFAIYETLILLYNRIKRLELVLDRQTPKEQ